MDLDKVNDTLKFVKKFKELAKLCENYEVDTLINMINHYIKILPLHKNDKVELLKQVDVTNPIYAYNQHFLKPGATGRVKQILFTSSEEPLYLIAFDKETYKIQNIFYKKKPSEKSLFMFKAEDLRKL